jgi:hypothetical protein
MVPNHILEKSILVVAHPDDEVLWFSSVLDKVDKIIFCFLECQSRPVWTKGRKLALLNHPLRNLSCLEIDESAVYSDYNWYNPVITEYGIKIKDKNKLKMRYKQNYYELKRKLQPILQNYSNVITHNPWGEYGNEEHIQIYRVLNELQQINNYHLWFNNYCSNKSLKIVLDYIYMLDFDSVTFKTNKRLSKDIQMLYQKYECWTWYDDWQMFDQETFIKNETDLRSIHKAGQAFPLNFIKVHFSNQKKGIRGIFKKLLSKWSRIRSAFQPSVLPK